MHGKQLPTNATLDTENYFESFESLQKVIFLVGKEKAKQINRLNKNINSRDIQKFK